MSILEGGVDYKQVYPISNPYGAVLQECAFLELAGARDVAVNESGDTAYIAGRNILYTVDVSRPRQPAVIGQVSGIRQGRQIEVQQGIAVITSRDEGLFICDVRDPRNPRILSHYDTIELAVGVWISGNLCFVTGRHYGVEIIDITDAEHPVHVSNILAGEAQSVFVDGSTMYAGVWMQREVHAIDISNPAVPRLLSKYALDGFGDGVFVKDGICYAATGHHAGRLTNRLKYANYDFVTEEMLHDGFGGGHGLEIFDVSDPRNPVFLSRIKTPPLFAKVCDFWDVTVSGDYAFVADTSNGVFVVNVANPREPFFEGYRRLDLYQGGPYWHEPSVQQLCDPVEGIAVIRNHVLAVSAKSGLHVLVAPETTDVPRYPVPVRLEICRPEPSPQTFFHTDGQIHGLDFVGDIPLVAAGDQGLYMLDSDNGFSVVDHVQTEGPAIDVKTSGRYIYLAEGIGGFSIWQLDSDKLRPVSRFKLDSSFASLRQVVLLEGTGLVALHVGAGGVVFVDISSPDAPVCKGVFPGGVAMYYKSIVDGLLNQRYVAVTPLLGGITWFDVSDPIKRVHDRGADECRICPIEEGIAIGKNGIFTILRGQYSYSQGIDPIPLEEKLIPLSDPFGEQIYLSGKPVLLGDTLCLLNRQNGLVTMLDVSVPEKPVVTKILTLEGNPERILCHKESYWVCCGHGGLKVIRGDKPQ